MAFVEHSNAPAEAPVALITGITGQDGGYLAELLLGKGYIVHGVARETARLDRARFSRFMGLRGRLHLHDCDLRDGDALEDLLRVVRPNEIYNLAAQTHVQTSLEDPAYTAEVNAAGTVRLLETLVKLGHERRSRFFQACSSEIFGDARGVLQNEKTPFHPLNPYAASKRAAFEAAVHFRNAAGVFASNGILFNHESPYRSPSFVTRKIALGVAASQQGEKTPLRLGNLDARRDWGHAGDYVRAMWLMLQQEKPEDYVIASGETHSVREFVELAFGVIGRRIIWEGSGVRERGVDAASGQVLVEIDPAFFRAADAGMTLGDASKARAELGWRPQLGFEDLVKEMVTADIERMGAPAGAEAKVASD